MIVMGIDPGTAIMGYGIVEGGARTVHAVAYGALTTAKGRPAAERLKTLYDGLTALIASHHPDAVAVEELFHGANARTVIPVGQARGIALLAAAQASTVVYEYTPPQVKSAVTGYGNAPKDQVQRMVATILALPTVPKPDDVADALAVAVCHAHSARSLAVS